MFIKIAASRQR